MELPKYNWQLLELLKSPESELSITSWNYRLQTKRHVYFILKITGPFCFLEEISWNKSCRLYRKSKIFSILPFLDILYLSIITCSYGFRHQINVTSQFSCTYCLNSQWNKNVNFNLRFPFPLSSQIRINAGKSNTQTEKEVENANVATYNFNSSALLSSSCFYTRVSHTTNQ